MDCPCARTPAHASSLPCGAIGISINADHRRFSWSRVRHDDLLLGPRRAGLPHPSASFPAGVGPCQSGMVTCILAPQFLGPSCVLATARTSRVLHLPLLRSTRIASTLRARLGRACTARNRAPVRLPCPGQYNGTPSGISLPDVLPDVHLGPVGRVNRTWVRPAQNHSELFPDSGAGAKSQALFLSRGENSAPSIVPSSSARAPTITPWYGWRSGSTSY